MNHYLTDMSRAQKAAAAERAAAGPEADADDGSEG
jgi:hypothetical protein